MLINEIRTELVRLQLHPVNLDASAGESGHILLRGSLLTHWAVPQTVDGEWFVNLLKTLPDLAGPEATMNAFCAANSQRARAV